MNAIDGSMGGIVTQPLSPLLFFLFFFLLYQNKALNEIYALLTIAFSSVLFPLDCGPITATTP